METSTFQKKTLQSLFNHIALPAKLPQRQEYGIDDIEHALVDHLISAAKGMRDCQEGEYYRIWESLRRTLESCKSLNIGGRVERTQLISYLKKMQTSDLIILHIATQNAGILIHRPTE